MLRKELRDYISAVPGGSTPAWFIEKDYWIVQSLRALQANFADSYVFKGGSSLSMGFGIIERFSEDIDLVVTSDADTEKAIKDMCEAVCTLLGATKVEPKREIRGVSGSYRIKYPKIQLAARVGSAIQLDIGVDGGSEPHARIAIKPLIVSEAEKAGFELQPHEDLDPVVVPVLDPLRTLAEKLAAIHTDVTRANVRVSTGKHSYDVYRLLGDRDIVTRLQETDEFLGLVEQVEDQTRHWFDEEPVPRPTGGYASSNAFRLSGEVAETLEEKLDYVKRTYLHPDADKPSFQDVCARIETFTERL